MLAHAALASRKDARDAVVAARKAFSGWSGATAYNRGQVLYRVAEMLEGRAGQFTDEVFVAEKNGDRDGAARDVAQAIDRWVWYAGWPDKVAQVTGGANPVAGPYFNLSVPEPTGVVAVLAPPAGGLLGLASVLAPVIATGNTAVLLASGPAVLAAVSLAEVLATSDVPGGVVNVLTGRPGRARAGARRAPGRQRDRPDRRRSGGPGGTRAARGRERQAGVRGRAGLGGREDWAADPGMRRLLAFLETKTVWHPVGT